MALNRWPSAMEPATPTINHLASDIWATNQNILDGYEVMQVRECGVVKRGAVPKRGRANGDPAKKEGGRPHHRSFLGVIRRCLHCSVPLTPHEIIKVSPEHTDTILLLFPQPPVQTPTHYDPPFLLPHLRCVLCPRTTRMGVLSIREGVFPGWPCSG